MTSFPAVNRDLLEQHARGEVGGGAGNGNGQDFAFQVGQRGDFRLRIDRHHGAIQDAGDIDHRFAVQTGLDDFAAGIDDLEILADQRLRRGGGSDVADVDVQTIFGEEISVRGDPKRREAAAKRSIVCSDKRSLARRRAVGGQDEHEKQALVKFS